ncbi:hypothetical protein HX109_04480 [Galbibacter sp. BG1]|uniref:FISUMP domain-containing protein n=1 Tax=Galbibacter sp. BG1 TaxID=1170699 RepID=UPI0015B7A50F|nr:FISUMP domain-containing protein [Galbibacter sp. BG1]QLE00858.1 hypothetical protein HX109_04480 [Galbibacter sp. BG1]
MKNLLILLLLPMFLLSCSNDDDNNSENFEEKFITDSRDGQIYETVRIGNQTWFAENLNFDKGDFRSSCYDNDELNCVLLGRLYENITAISCPDGWHIPTKEEWEELFDYLGGINVAHLLVEPGATFQGNQVNFNLLPAGRRAPQIGSYDFGTGGYYATSSANQNNLPYYVEYIPEQSIEIKAGNFSKSCRCLKD